MSDFLTDEQMAALEAEERKKSGAVKTNPLQEIVDAKPAKRAAEPPSGFISDEEMERYHPDDVEWGGVDFLTDVGHGLGRAATAVDQYTAAPIRALVGDAAGIETKRERPSMLSVFLPAFAGGESIGNRAPSGKQIAAKLGVSEEEFALPLNADPTGRKMRTSPAGIAGGLGETAMDITNLAGLGEAKMIGGVGRRMAQTGEDLGNFAAERAVKAATGESKPNLKRFANVKGGNARDARAAMDRIRNSGRILLERDPNFGGEPAIGFFDTAKDIGEEAERRRQFYGQQIGSVGAVADKYAPGYITPEHLSEDTRGLTKGLLNIGEDKQIRRGLLDEAQDMQRPIMAEDEIGPQSPLKFEDLQRIKNRYKFTPPSGQASANAADIETKLKGNVGRRMDEWVDQAKGNPAYARKLGTVGDELTGLKREIGDAYKEGVPAQHKQEMHDATRSWNSFADEHDRLLDAVAPQPSRPDLEKLNSYPHAKSRYGTYENASAAGANQSINTLNRNFFSPSSKLAAATTFLADAKSGGLTRAAQAASAAGVNQSVLNRGNAFTARTANAIAQKLSRNARVYQKYFAPLLQTGAITSNSGLVALHHQLMNNDPEYRAAMLDGEEP